jgi:benzoyl-CoA reductase/2-hydroxyglutaryl-CoA dehydratase subunit BcrC/BadD/HgdB
MCRGGEPEPPDAVLDNMLRFMNPLARSMAGFLELGLDPVTPNCDLLVTQQTDCHVARITELLEFKGVKLNKVGIPGDWQKPVAFDYYVRSLRAMVAQVEEVTGNKVDWDKARENFAKTNKINALFRRLNEMRKRKNPPIGLNEMIHLHHYSFMVDNDIMIEKLEQLCDELENAPGIFADDAPRILFAGRALAIGDYTVPRVLESSGAAIVAEMMDEGIRVYEKDVELEGDLVYNFAKNRYLDTVPNNIFQPAWMDRYEYMKKLIDEYKVDGVIWYQLAFDEIYDMECTCLAKWFEDSETTFLKLESSYEYSRESMGPLTTRIESFVESLKEGK